MPANRSTSFAWLAPAAQPAAPHADVPLCAGRWSAQGSLAKSVRPRLYHSITMLMHDCRVGWGLMRGGHGRACHLKQRGRQLLPCRACARSGDGPHPLATPPLRTGADVRLRWGWVLAPGRQQRGSRTSSLPGKDEQPTCPACPQAALRPSAESPPPAQALLCPDHALLCRRLLGLHRRVLLPALPLRGPAPRHHGRHTHAPAARPAHHSQLHNHRPCDTGAADPQRSQHTLNVLW